MTISGIYHGLNFSLNDGGRLDAGFKGGAGDCVTRAIAIATGAPYRRVYNELKQLQTEMTGGLKRSVRGGVGTAISHKYLTDRGWQLYITNGEYMTGETIPMARVVIAMQHRHMVTVVDGTVNDTWDSRRSSRTKNGANRLLGFYVL